MFPFTEGEYKLKAGQARLDGSSLTVDDAVANVRDIRAVVDGLAFGNEADSEKFRELFEQGEAVRSFQRSNKSSNSPQLPDEA
jgi:hypothetical protein